MSIKLLERIKELEQRGSLIKTEGSAIERFAALLSLAAIDPKDPSVQRFNAILAEFNQHKISGVVTEKLKLKHDGKDQQVANLALEAALDE